MGIRLTEMSLEFTVKLTKYIKLYSEGLGDNIQTEFN